MHKVLLVWLESPENERVFILDFEDEQAYRRCLACNGQFLNTVNDEDVDEQLNELSETVGRATPIYDGYEKLKTVRSFSADNVALVVSGVLL